jgi:hypothetical protein
MGDFHVPYLATVTSAMFRNPFQARVDRHARPNSVHFRM